MLTTPGDDREKHEHNHEANNADQNIYQRISLDCVFSATLSVRYIHGSPLGWNSQYSPTGS